MEIEMSFRSLVLSPSRSRPCFAVKFCIVAFTVAGEVSPISRFGGLGFGGINSSGLANVGLTDLEILTPASEKKRLNSSAMWLGLFEGILFILICSIFWLLLDKLVASFKCSQVFLGFWH
jgi:hypothetical protein